MIPLICMLLRVWLVFLGYYLDVSRIPRGRLKILKLFRRIWRWKIMDMSPLRKNRRSNMFDIENRYSKALDEIDPQRALEGFSEVVRMELDKVEWLFLKMPSLLHDKMFPRWFKL
ncbi:hypothetical protein MKW98_024778 [Papaver atlanticum]|uniref:Uncharacterized protein n=1 Tax=Papaver atlanticum TaxID=357466 RepID=A0AAD4XRB5_9MAGN|nr:hypothetical protein MKW98_024778 [Papaver atlanticum]